MTPEFKKRVMQYLDSQIGKDLIESVHNAKEIFNLTDSEFYPIFKEWEISPVVRL